MGWSTAIAPSNQIGSNGLKTDRLPTENAHLRELLAQSGIDAQRLLLKAGIATSESETALRLQRLLIEELHHRSRNSLAVVMAITSQTLKNAGSLAEARIALERRLSALDRTQSLLLRTNWASARLGDVVGAAIEPFNDLHEPQFDVGTTALDVTGVAVLPISLSLNELCTNAVKYGSLSVAAGRVAISLRVNDAAQRFNLKWTETGGPLVHEPTRQSFGTKLIKLMASQIAGDVCMRYEPAGFIYELDVPLSAICDPSEPVLGNPHRTHN